MILHFVTAKWSIVNNQSNGNYAVGYEIIYGTEVLKYNFYDYNDNYILARSGITDVAATTGREIQVAFKNCAPFIKCIAKIYKTTIFHASV